MNIIIVGAGALGLLYGARLALAGHGVVLLTRSDEQAGALNDQGLLYKEATGAETKVGIPAASVRQFVDAGAGRGFGADWAVLAVKQPHVDAGLLADLERLLRGGVPLLALQNGIGHMERLAEALPASRVYAAVTTEGALKPDERTVRHTGTGRLAFGRWDGRNDDGAEAQKMLLDALADAGIEANLSNEIKDQVFLKLLLNAVINPLTAIYQVRNGELPRDPYRLRLMRALHDESEAILRAAGLRSKEDLWERLLGVCAATAGNESSMLRDVRAGRMTEIDWINGGIAGYAKRLGLSSRMNDAVLALVKALRVT
ncbi:2-dehydropantoate 2-reductase [Paenibacillus sp. UNC496MF]|uniref:ketopantoate reductase family protein n=1 Tax=Paenibacillus sp. UNC496MF TaxID=1502753 RepID=UPI0008E9BDB4|nr:2-dehydropantoate 2-reductase [Paenibacillus sp. UNC496MF]SFI60614.1 2-dehydropantoate 2-reductase [Paenibacillus sp. UNC496MF]